MSVLPRAWRSSNCDAGPDRARAGGPVSASAWWILLGAFLGGAVPWVEAIVVIPVVILAGGPVVPAVALAILGNLLTVWVAAVFGERVRGWWVRRRQARREKVREENGGVEPDPQHRERWDRRMERINRVMRRWGMPGLAILGPLGLGTQFSALAAVAVGQSSRAAFIWVGAGTIGWSLASAALTVAGVSVLGIGA